MIHDSKAVSYECIYPLDVKQPAAAQLLEIYI